MVTRLNEGLVPRNLLMELPDDLLLLCSLKLLDEDILAAQHLSWACSSLQRRPTQNSGLGCEANNHEIFSRGWDSVNNLASPDLIRYI